MSGLNITENNYNALVNPYRQQNPGVRQITNIPEIAPDTFTKNNAGVQNTVKFAGYETETVQQPKKSHTFRNIFLSVIGLSAVATGVALHVGGGIRNAFKNKEVISTAKAGFSKIFKKKSAEIVKPPVSDVIIPQKDPGVFTVTKNGGLKTCTIPGKSNYSYNVKANGSVAQQAQKIGLLVNSGTVPKNATVKSYSFTYRKFLGIKYTVTVTNGKNIIVKNAKGKTVKLSENAMNKIKTSVENANEGNTKDLKDYIVQSYKVTENGVTAQYRRQNGNYKISSFIADKFAVDSDEAIAYCAKKPEAKALVDAIKHGNKDLNRISGEVNCRLGTFKIENGEIIGLTERGIYYPNSDAHFIALQEKNKQLFKDVLDNKYRYKTETFGL